MTNGALLEITYYIVLGRAYKDSDLSLVYPMGRGAAPTLIAVWTAIFLHERVTLGGLIGITIIYFIEWRKCMGIEPT